MTKRTQHILIGAAAASILLAGIGFWAYSTQTQTDDVSSILSNTGLIDLDESDLEFEPYYGENERVVILNAPELQNVNYSGDAPLYLYTFTHTEDHINHELSEERYWRIGEIVENLIDQYKIPFTWTIQFQGADANTVAERNDETGLLDYLLSMNKSGYIEFGYHGHHDPTYNNRPHKNLGTGFTFDDMYEALYEWMTCKKDGLRGGCIATTGGGIDGILKHFGQVEVVSGIGSGTGLLVERGAASLAINELLPGRLLGFGFPDHGATLKNDNYTDARDELLEIMTPTNDTSSSILWFDNTLRLNDGIPLDGLNTLSMKDTIEDANEILNGVDRSRPNTLNVGIADKYIYTAPGTSPTKWAYANRVEPELPDQWVNSRSVIEGYYNQTEETLEYLMGLATQGDVEFVSSDGVVDLMVDNDYWSVDEEELENIVAWLLNEWNTTPPAYVYDGEDYYSLTDTFYLLISGLRGSYVESGLVSVMYGPWSDVHDRTQAREIDANALRSFAHEFDEAMIPEVITIDRVRYSPAQILYALAYLYLADEQGAQISSIDIPATENAPETYELLELMECEDCLDTSWSMKPARFVK